MFQHIYDHSRPKIENLKFFRKFLSPRKVPKGEFFHFSQAFFRENTFQHISDHSSPKNKNRKVPQGGQFLLFIFFAKILPEEHFSTYFQPFQATKIENLKFLPKISKSQKSSLRGKILIVHFFRKNSSGRALFNIFLTILGQETKIKNLKLLSKISKSQKSPLRVNFLFFIFRKNSFGRACFDIFPTFLGQ